MLGTRKQAHCEAGGWGPFPARLWGGLGLVLVAGCALAACGDAEKGALPGPALSILHRGVDEDAIVFSAGAFDALGPSELRGQPLYPPPVGKDPRGTTLASLQESTPEESPAFLLATPLAPGLHEAVRDLASRRILVSFGGPPPGLGERAHVGTDEAAAGRRLAVLARAKAFGKGRALVFTSDAEAEGQEERFEAFLAAWREEAPDGEAMPLRVRDDGSSVGAYSAVETALKGEAEVPSILVGLAGHHGSAILELLKPEALGDAGAPIVLSGARERTLEGLLAKRVAATVVHDPFVMGRMATQTALEALKGEAKDAPAELLLVPLRVLLPKDAEERLKARETHRKLAQGEIAIQPVR